MKIQSQFKNEIRPFVMLFSMLIIWFAFNHVTDGAFLQARNLSNLLRQMAITGILASGMVLVIVAAQIDLSIGSLTAFLGGIIAVCDQKYPGQPGRNRCSSLRSFNKRWAIREARDVNKRDQCAGEAEHTPK